MCGTSVPLPQPPQHASLPQFSATSLRLPKLSKLQRLTVAPHSQIAARPAPETLRRWGTTQCRPGSMPIGMERDYFAKLICGQVAGRSPPLPRFLRGYCATTSLQRWLAKTPAQMGPRAFQHGSGNPVGVLSKWCQISRLPCQHGLRVARPDDNLAPPRLPYPRW